MPDMRKPDYDDLDWTNLIRDRQAKWVKMWDELRAQGLKPVTIWDNGTPKQPRSGSFEPKLMLMPVHKGTPRGTFIVCAGGGGKFKSSNEAKPVAEFFHAKGLNAAILDYTIDPDAEMGSEQAAMAQRAMGEDGNRAIRYLRYHAKELGIREDKIAIGGFSEGGAVSCYASTHFEDGDPLANDPLARVSSRPDATILIYSCNPVEMIGISGFGRQPYEYEHQAKQIEFATDAMLTPKCAPFFLMQTAHDDPRRCLLVGMRLASLGIPFEVHLFEEGGHGQGLYDGGCEDSPLYPHTSMWGDIAADWLINNRKF